jgi:hypothetical protein
MGRQPFFGSSGASPIAKMDMYAATAPGRFIIRLFHSLGKQLVEQSLSMVRIRRKKKPAN